MIVLQDMTCPYCNGPLDYITDTRWICHGCGRQTIVHKRTSEEVKQPVEEEPAPVAEVKKSKPSPRLVEFTYDGIRFAIMDKDNREVYVSHAPTFTEDMEMPSEVEYEGEMYRVTGICGLSFNRSSGLSTVKIPPGFKVGTHLFSGMEIPGTFHIPDTIEEPCTYMFSDCRGLKTIRIPARFREIPDGMFDGCKDLESVEFEGPVEHIGAFAFANCPKLRSITARGYTPRIESESTVGSNEWLELPDCVRSIDKGAFVLSDLELVFTDADRITPYEHDITYRPYSENIPSKRRVIERQKDEPGPKSEPKPVKKKGLFGFLRR